MRKELSNKQTQFTSKFETLQRKEPKDNHVCHTDDPSRVPDCSGREGLHQGGTGGADPGGRGSCSVLREGEEEDQEVVREEVRMISASPLKF